MRPFLLLLAACGAPEADRPAAPEAPTPAHGPSRMVPAAATLRVDVPEPPEVASVAVLGALGGAWRVLACVDALGREASCPLVRGDAIALPDGRTGHLGAPEPSRCGEDDAAVDGFARDPEDGVLALWPAEAAARLRLPESVPAGTLASDEVVRLVAELGGRPAAPEAVGVAFAVRAGGARWIEAGRGSDDPDKPGVSFVFREDPPVRVLRPEGLELNGRAVPVGVLDGEAGDLMLLHTVWMEGQGVHAIWMDRAGERLLGQWWCGA